MTNTHKFFALPVSCSCSCSYMRVNSPTNELRFPCSLGCFSFFSKYFQRDFLVIYAQLCICNRFVSSPSAVLNSLQICTFKFAVFNYYMFAYINTCMHTYIHTCTQICMYIHILAAIFSLFNFTSQLLDYSNCSLVLKTNCHILSFLNAAKISNNKSPNPPPPTPSQVLLLTTSPLIYSLCDFLVNF